MTSPYADLPDRSFWKRAVVEAAQFTCGIARTPKHLISPSDGIVTAGSCFAQHISRALRRRGFTFLDLEPPPPELPLTLHAKYGYGLYSARYGNLYTAAQLRQLVMRAFGRFDPVESAWETETGHWVDPYRPAIEPEGFASRDEMERDRRFHLKQVVTLLKSADVMVFTLGLTESWRSSVDGAVFPMCPGTRAGKFQANRHLFVNSSVWDVIDDLKWTVEFLRRRNSKLRFVLTVSPVPLTATATGDHVLTATMKSKSILRVAAEHVAETHDNVDYFPSYEIVNAPAWAEGAFESNLRTVKPEIVDAVMDVFFREFCDGEYSQIGTEPLESQDGSDGSREEVWCDEEALAAGR